MSELICIDDSYTAEQLAVFALNNIKFPKEGELVELLKVVKYPRKGTIGLIIAPYQGQFIKGINMGVEGSVELSFNYKRFAKLNGEQFTEEEILEIKKELQLTKTEKL